MPSPQIEGLPEGAIVKPIEGLPEGAIVRPHSQAPAAAPDEGPGYWERLTNPVGSGAAEQGIIGGARQIGGQAIKTITQPFMHPVDTAKSIYHTYADPLPSLLGPKTDSPKTLADFSPETAHAVESFKKDPALTLENAAGTGLGMFEGGRLSSGLGKMAEPMTKPIGEAMQRGGKGIINRTLGATARNFERGKDPAAGFFDENIGPSMSMGSIARKAGDAKNAVGKNIGNAVDNATAQGKRIPSQDFVPAITDPIHEARSVLQGPGGGSTASIDALEDTFRPTLAKPDATPRELFDVKKNVGRNTNWGNATDVGLKQTRQQIAGGLSKPLEQHVPELQELNPRYANASELTSLATKRTNSGVPVMSQVGRKLGETALGGAIGYATHNPVLSLAPLAIDTVPAQTTIATGLYRGGAALPSLPKAAGVLPPGAAISRIPHKKPEEEADEK